MGGHQSRLSEDDLEELQSRTQLSKVELSRVFKEYAAVRRTGVGDANSEHPSGELNYDEFKMFLLERLQIKADESLVQRLFETFDADKSQTISFKEFLLSASILEAGTPEQKLEFMFKVYDEDNSGFLEDGELENLLKQMIKTVTGLGHNHTEALPLLRKMLVDLSSHESGRISLQEWVEGGTRAAPLLAALGLDASSFVREGKHKWYLKTFVFGAYCNVCEKRLNNLGKQGLRCQVCKVCSHEECAYRMESPCRPTFVKSFNVKGNGDETPLHHWVLGNFGQEPCMVCRKDCGKTKSLDGWRCAWCKRSCHAKCQGSVPPRCNLGALRDLILPSTAFRLKSDFGSQLQLDVHSLALAHASDPETPSTSSTTTTTTTTALASIATVTASSSPKLVHASSVDSVASIPSSPSPFDPSASISLSNKLNIVPLPETTPLVVFINPKSGGNQGAKLMRQLQFLLNPRQLFDLNDGGPARGLEMFQKVPGYQVLCCGGDGTVGWVLSVLDKLNPSSWPPIGIVPLGTGNDLARALNWGGGYTGEPMKRLLELYDTEIKYLDRWRLDITESVSSEDSEGDDAPLDIVNNYFSIGVDAHIARKFHLMREKHPQKFSSRARNKLWYAQFGTQDALQHKFKNVHQSVSLECDGVKLDLGEGHKLEGIAVVNITSMYGGADLWGTPSKNDTKFGQQDMGDGRLEVVGLYSSVHVGRLTTGISSGAHRICQGSVIRITTVDTLPMQVDGEPWMQRPGVIELTHKNKAPMLRKLAKKERESNRIPSKSGY